MSRYSIEGSTLTAIGDAIREKTGKLTRVETEIYIETLPAMTVSKTPNATGGFDANAKDGNCPAGDFYDVVSFPGASSIKVDYGLAVHFPNVDYLQIAPGRYSAVDFPQDETEKIVKPGGASLVRDQIIIENTDTITFHLYTTYEMPVMGYYAECTSFDADGNPLGGEQIEVEREVEVPNTLTPTQMAEEINNFPPSPPNEAFILTGDCSYRFAHNGWNWFIKNYWDKVTTKDISATQYMFYNCAEVEQIPFDINITPDNNGNAIMNTFYDCVKLKNIPKIKGVKAKELGSLFSGCFSLREVTEDFYEDWDWSLLDGSTNSYTGDNSALFTRCYSLRKYPNSFLAHGNPKASSSYTIYYNLFANCYSLDEIVNLPVQHREAAWTATYTNAFMGTATHCCRLKNFTFETNDDGSPIVIKNWAYQVIDLSQAVGYATQIYMENNILNHNSGITVDKEVTNDASYQALKNDPDWFTADMKYSRYNHDSAVATINSLPDVSAKTGNTIKFKGAAGELTDGGAINTLTEEEIAVATAKGWTVTLS